MCDLGHSRTGATNALMGREGRHDDKLEEKQGGVYDSGHFKTGSQCTMLGEGGSVLSCGRGIKLTGRD